MISNSSTHWVIEFYASWCGHCQAYKPTYIAFAKDIEGLSTSIVAYHFIFNCLLFRLESYHQSRGHRLC